VIMLMFQGSTTLYTTSNQENVTVRHLTSELFIFLSNMFIVASCCK